MKFTIPKTPEQIRRQHMYAGTVTCVAKTNGTLKVSYEYSNSNVSDKPTFWSKVKRMFK